MARAHATTNHDKIRKWVEARGGHPSAVKATRRAGSPGGLLRIDFGPKEASLQAIDWSEFFAAFDGNQLAFLYQEKTADGSTSRFFKLVDRDTLDEETLNASQEEDSEEEDADENEDEDEDEVEEDEEDDDDDEDDDEELDDEEEEEEEEDDPPTRSSKKS